MSQIKWLIIAPIAVFIAIQLLPVWLLQNNPPVQSEPPWDSPQTRALAQRACFDCHSNQTNWPWYSRIAPFSWYVTYDVLRGRSHLNFSEWNAVSGRGEGGERGGRGVARTILDGSMPPPAYLLTHPQGALSDAEKQQLIQGLQNSLQ